MSRTDRPRIVEPRADRHLHQSGAECPSNPSPPKWLDAGTPACPWRETGHEHKWEARGLCTRIRDDPVSAAVSSSTLSLRPRPARLAHLAGPPRLPARLGERTAQEVLDLGVGAAQFVACPPGEGVVDGGVESKQDALALTHLAARTRLLVERAGISDLLSGSLAVEDCNGFDFSTYCDERSGSATRSTVLMSGSPLDSTIPLHIVLISYFSSARTKGGITRKQDGHHADVVFRDGKLRRRERSAGEPAPSVRDLTKRFYERVADGDVSSEIGDRVAFGGSAAVGATSSKAANGAAARQLVAIMPESPGLYFLPRLTVCAGELPTAHPSGGSFRARPRLRR